jgi:hypothetical protein
MDFFIKCKEKYTNHSIWNIWNLIYG